MRSAAATAATSDAVAQLPETLTVSGKYASVRFVPARPTRRTQAERTASTRAALLDATLESLVDVGFAGTTTTEVARRAGVSLGALVHHFPAKADLLTAAVGHLLDRRQSEFRKAMADADMGAPRLATAIDALWSQYDGPTFAAYLELWVAARTDPDLRAAAVAMSEEFARTSDEVFRELFPPAEYPDAGFLEFGRSFAMALLDGVALHRSVNPSGETREPLVEILKFVATELVERVAGGSEP